MTINAPISGRVIRFLLGYRSVELAVLQPRRIHPYCWQKSHKARSIGLLRCVHSRFVPIIPIYGNHATRILPYLVITWLVYPYITVFGNNVTRINTIFGDVLRRYIPSSWTYISRDQNQLLKIGGIIWNWAKSRRWNIGRNSQGMALHYWGIHPPLWFAPWTHDRVFR